MFFCKVAFVDDKILSTKEYNFEVEILDYKRCAIYGVCSVDS